MKNMIMIVFAIVTAMCEGMEYRDNNFLFSPNEWSRPDVGLQVLGQATIEELHNFAMAKCYNTDLRDKLSHGAALTEEEAVTLKFIVDVNAMLLTALTARMKSKILGAPMQPPYSGRGVIPLEYMELSKRFAEDEKSPARQRIDAFASHFSPVDFATKVSIKAMLETNLVSEAGVRDWLLHFRGFVESEYKEDFRQHLQDGRFGPGVFSELGFGYVGGTIMRSALRSVRKAPMDADLVTHHIPPVCKKIEGDKDIGEDWSAALDSTCLYLREFVAIKKALEAYRSHPRQQDSGSRILANKLFDHANESWRISSRLYCFWFYDMPFTLLTYRAYAQYRGCKGDINDDEAGMERVLVQYSNSVCGAKIIKHVGSSMALDIYGRLITDVKSDLNERFETLKTTLALWGQAQRTNNFDDNTGLPLNAEK